MAKLLTLARHAAILGLIPPTRIRQAKAQLKIPVAMLQHEMRSLFSAIAKYKGTIRGVPGHVFMLALLLTMLVTGERVNALCHVTRDDVDLRGRWIRVRFRKQTGNEMMKRLNRPTAKAIRALMESHNHERIFGIVHRTSLYKPLNDILRSAGLPVDRQHKFHCLRRSHASYLKRAGGDARASLGQSSEEITVKYYYDPRLTEHVHPVDLLFNPVSPWNRLLGWLGL